ncbi:MAG: exodeoxyribonuclease III [Alphaproteobacteria bacterium]|nr:exodeoxyribonuclease III [Alphaproteobacteria bacterium]
MRLVTWNINSVRLRIDTVMKLVAKAKPDVLCLQETKTPDAFFPADAFADKGFVHQHFTGMKGYNGVAILSRLPLADKAIHRRCGKDDCRHISAKVKLKGNPFELHNIYIPAGGDEPDPEANDKFRHKLDFVDELTAWFAKERGAKKPMIAVGDLNIAPLENDVWDHKKLLKVVSHTPVEVEKFTRFYESVDWVDAVRHFVPEEKKLYSWWSYRAKDWDAADKGRRLDHIWVTKKLKPALQKQQILREVRGWERPSDHAPVILDIKEAA